MRTTASDSIAQDPYKLNSPMNPTIERTQSLPAYGLRATRLEERKSVYRQSFYKHNRLRTDNEGGISVWQLKQAYT